ncbi:MAG: hypothetical protein OEV00_09220, partial [Acidobacteriota bacterium]|nr:hypothetical protein [Acidobacteriota bacterium]
MIIHGPRRFRGLLLSVVTVLLCLSTDAYASPFEKFSDGLIVRQDETLQGDLYFTTTTADIQGHVIGDLSGFTAYDFNITGTVDGDVNICGQSVTLSGTIQDSLRSWTNNTTISGTVERDVMIFAGSVTLLPSAHIKGKLTAFGGTVSLRGTIDGDVMVTAGTINIDSQMGGDVRLEGIRST